MTTTKARKADTTPTAGELWRRRTTFARRNENFVAVEARGGLVAVADLRPTSEGTVTVFARNKTIRFSARPAVHGDHGAIPFIRDNTLCLVWTSVDKDGSFIVSEVTTSRRIARVIDISLSETEALELAKQVAGLAPATSAAAAAA